MGRRLVMTAFMGVLVLFPVCSWSKGTNSVDHRRLARGMQTVTPEQLHRALKGHFHQYLNTGNIKVTIRVLSPQQGIQVPHGPMTIHIPPDPLGGRTGRRAFRMGIHVNSHLTKVINVIAEVAAQARVVSPVRWIKANEILQADDVISVQTSLPSLHHDFVLDLQEAIGKKAKRPLSPNQPLQNAFLSFPPVIQKGDRVIIEARRGGLLIQTVGIAKESGQLGKTISVQNQTSGREISGRVLRAGIVEVQF